MTKEQATRWAPRMHLIDAGLQPGDSRILSGKPFQRLLLPAMPHDPFSILSVFDACARRYTFLMLDNGYVYPAATRLALFRSSSDWALVFEHFGYSPRAGCPDLTISTFASRLKDRNPPIGFATPEAYQNYLWNHPHDELRGFAPIESGPWMDTDVYEHVGPVGAVRLRGIEIALPALREYALAGIELAGPQPAIYELCRYLAHHHRNQVLATSDERQVSVPDELNLLLVLDDWHHPNLAEGQMPSETESFRQFAQVLSTGDVARYRPSETPNVHWTHWPEGGSL